LGPSERWGATEKAGEKQKYFIPKNQQGFSILSQCFDGSNHFMRKNNRLPKNPLSYLSPEIQNFTELYKVRGSF
jgi:hypothetical protein